MRSLKSLCAAASLGLVLAACADHAGPTGLDAIRAGKSSSKTTGTVAVDTSSSTLYPLRFVSWAPPLETYDTTFAIVQGRASSDTIYFQKQSWELARVPFMVLTTPKDAQFVDASGQVLPNGSTVRLTVHADKETVQLNFGPHGSTFKKPAKLQIFWLYTDLLGQLASGLNLWYQPEVGTTWSPLATQVDLQYQWLVSDLYHFSNYAVAFRR